MVAVFAVVLFAKPLLVYFLTAENLPDRLAEDGIHRLGLPAPFNSGLVCILQPYENEVYLVEIVPIGFDIHKYSLPGISVPEGTLGFVHFDSNSRHVNTKFYSKENRLSEGHWSSMEHIGNRCLHPEVDNVVVDTKIYSNGNVSRTIRFVGNFRRR